MITTKKMTAAICASTLLLAGCSNLLPNSVSSVFTGTSNSGAVSQAALGDYKQDVAQRIIVANPSKTYTVRPQALLRSVIVLKFYIGANGQLLRSEIMRSNKDRTNEATALASLKNAAPFPPPASRYLRNGRVEMIETWLFNDDGRFQLHSTAAEQMHE